MLAVVLSSFVSDRELDFGVSVRELSDSDRVLDDSIRELEASVVELASTEELRELASTDEEAFELASTELLALEDSTRDETALDDSTFEDATLDEATLEASTREDATELDTPVEAELHEEHVPMECEARVREWLWLDGLLRMEIDALDEATECDALWLATCEEWWLWLLTPVDAAVLAARE